MSNPFLVNKELNNKVPRSTHDLSHQVNGSYSFGRLYPVLCQEVGEGFSFRLNKSVLGLRALPMVFPVQTPMRATLHYFYVRTRTLWKDWMDFKFNTKSGLSQPHTGSNSRIRFGTGELCDYLGVPTRVYGPGAKLETLDIKALDYGTCTSKGSVTVEYPFLFLDDFASQTTLEVWRYPYRSLLANGKRGLCSVKSGHTVLVPFDIAEFRSTLINSTDLKGFNISLVVQGGNVWPTGAIDCHIGIASSTTGYFGLLSPNSCTVDGIAVNFKTFSLTDIQAIREHDVDVLYFVLHCEQQAFGNGTPVSPLRLRINASGASFVFPDGLDLSMIPHPQNPYLNGKCPLLTYPFRAYEAIYNSFYRNQQIDPLLDSQGRPEYNKYIVNDDGNEDVETYDFHYKLWESDIFTSCLPRPQDGPAPLVGIVTPDATSAQQLAIQDDDGNVRIVTPQMSEDGKVLKSIEVGDVERKDVKVLDMYNAPLMGITINDFRNVNALQRYLELNQRKGYRYKDLVKGHYDVDIRYDELMMPEFLGGISQDINVSTVMSTADTAAGSDGGQLGSYAGSASCIGQQGHTITKYCDEAGFIVGILCITPVPVYTQPLPKMFTRNHYLDYYTPEFANIGMQPIMRSQVSPLETFAGKGEDAVFGYQRPWADYLRCLDSAHGLMRSQLRNFLINRVFDGVPVLGKSFIEVRPDHLNDVFSSVLPNEDKFIGQIYFDISVKSPVPYTWIPRID